MRMFTGKNALVSMIATAGILTACGGVDSSGRLLGGRATGGIDDNTPRHHQEHEQEQERGHDDGIQHQERHRGGRSSGEDRTRPEQRIKNPGEQSSAQGAIISLALEKATPADDDSYKFEASGLPAGLTIDGTTGVISGTITAATGTYQVIVTAKELEETEDHLAAELKFTWTISAQ